MNTRVLKALFADKINLLLVGALALVGSGSSLNAGTTAYFTDTETANVDITTATVDLAANPFTNFTFSSVVPGDKVWKPVTVTNNSTFTIPYVLSIKESGGPVAGATGATGLKIVALRCHIGSGISDPTGPCNTTATHVRLIDGVHGTSTGHGYQVGDTALALSGAGLLNTDLAAAGAAVSGSAFTLGGYSITAVNILTSENATCSANGTDGACKMGGPDGAVTVSSPSITGVVPYVGASFTVPSHSTERGLATTVTDNLALIALLPTTATYGQIPANNTIAAAANPIFTAAFTGAQPNGTATLTNGAVRP